MDIEDNIWFFNEEQLATDGVLRVRRNERRGDTMPVAAVAGSGEFTQLVRTATSGPTVASTAAKSAVGCSSDGNGIGGGEAIRTVEWNMMNKQKFYPLSILSSFTIRCFLYPFSVIKTRIQVQRGNEHYKGTVDAFRKIVKYEGAGGLYKGFWINTFQIVSSVFYVTTYENVRHFMLAHNFTDSRVRALVAGGCASAVGQTFIVPCDVVSQHLMVIGQMETRSSGGPGGAPPVKVPVNPLDLDYRKYKSKFDLTMAIGRRVYERDGLLGFYRGYWASLCTYVPTSAMWWSFYQLYQDWLFLFLPSSVPTLAIQSIAAPLGGITTTIITNPLDIVRARLQVQRLDSVSATFISLWKEERLGIFKKGLSARVAQSCVFSFAIILGYESVKRLSVREEYRDRVRW